MASLATNRNRSAAAVHPAPPANLLLSALVDASEDAILSTAPDGTVTSWNRAAERFFGYPADEIIGQPVTTLIPARRQSEEALLLERAQRGEAVEAMETVRLRRDGTTVPVALTISALRNEAGESVGCLMVMRDLAHRHCSHDAKHLLAAIVDSSDDAIISKTLTGTITSWNRAAERMFGYTEAEMVGQSVLTLIPPDRQKDEAEILARLQRGEKIEHYETTRMAKSGQRLEVSLTLSPIRNDRGVIIGASKVVRDISALRKSVETAQHMAAIIESSDDGIISKNLDGVIQSWNPAAERIFGYTAPEIVGRPVLQLIPPERHYEEPEILAKVRRGERIDHYETIRVRKDGSRVEVSLTISPIKGAGGTVVGVAKIVRDLSSQRKADQATRLLAAIVDSSDDAIVSKNLNAIVTSWNAGAQRIFGYTAEEMIGRPISVLFPPDRLNEEPMILERLKRGERVEHYQTVRLRKGGEPLHVSLTISPIKDGTGRIVGASKIARDVTREIRALEQLSLANEELKRADRMKSEFLAVMSHELRTPLNSILGFTSVIRQGKQGPVTDDQARLLTMIHSSGKHLLHLINDLLDLSRIEAGRMEVEPEEFVVGEVIDEAIRTLEIQAAQKGLQVERAVDVAEPVFSDRKRLFQVILNLLNNAIKFTPAGSVSIRVVGDGDKLRVSVTDTGIGIPRAKQGGLFQAFSQVEGSSRRRYEGTGLGLYLCKKIVTLLGGEISMVSEHNRGSVFSFWVPMTRPAVAAAAEQATSLSQP